MQGPIMRTRWILIATALLLCEAAAAESPNHRLTLSASADNESGRDTGGSYQLSTDSISFFIGAYETEFAATFFDVDARSFARSVEGELISSGLDVYMGDWGLHAGASLSSSADGLEKDTFRLGVSYTGDRSSVRVQAISVDATQPLIVLASLDPVRFRRVEDQRDGTGVAFDVSWFLNENWMLIGDVQRVWYDDGLLSIARDRFDVRTPLNSAQRLIKWSAAAGVAWFVDDASLSLMFETLEDEDDDRRTTSAFLSLDVPVAERLSAGFSVGYATTQDDTSTTFGGVDLSIKF